MALQTNNKPVISIIVVVYNAVETLEDTIKSIVDQTYATIQLVIIDGQSNDGTLSILERYRSWIDILVVEKDEGIYDAMNKGLRYASGDWVLFLGSDDTLASNTIIAEVADLFTNRDTIYYGDTFLKNSKRVYQGEVNTMKLLLCNISHQAIFYPKSVYSVKQYDVRYKYFADHVHNLELFSENSKRFKYIGKLISVYNDAGRSSVLADVEYDNQVVGVVRKQFGLVLSAYVWIRRKVAKLKRRF